MIVLNGNFSLFPPQNVAMKSRIVSLTISAGLLLGCLANAHEEGGADHDHSQQQAEPEASVVVEVGDKVVDVDPSHFIEESLTGPIVKEERTLADGTKMMCFVIKAKSEPQEHQMGPWCPTTIADGKDKGGVWMDGGKLYDVDGKFIKGLAEFYSDSEWSLFREDGTVRVTDTKEAFEAAARPDVDPQYNNYCVEGNPEWYEEEVTTYVIPVTPVYQEATTRPGRGGVGLAFNGVNFDPPAPTEAILAAHTLAPLDDGGGHFNPHVGYHYHAATGKTKEVAQEDGHAPMIGYALDGFGIYAQLDEEGQAPIGLDAVSGHYDEIRGYHYHVRSAGENQIISAFHGVPGSMQVGDKAPQAEPEHGAKGNGPPPAGGKGKGKGKGGPRPE